MSSKTEKPKEIKIDSINIKVGGKELSLSLGEAKELNKLLLELFPVQVEKNNYIPYYINPGLWDNRPFWEVTWCGTTNSATFIANSSENSNIS